MFFQTPEFWVAIAFFIFMGIAWKMGAFSSMATGLDKRGERISITGPRPTSREGPSTKIVHPSVPIAETPAALKALADRKVMGKLVVRV